MPDVRKMPSTDHTTVRNLVERELGLERVEASCVVRRWTPKDITRILSLTTREEFKNALAEMVPIEFLSVAQKAALQASAAAAEAKKKQEVSVVEKDQPADIGISSTVITGTPEMKVNEKTPADGMQ